MRCVNEISRSILMNPSFFSRSSLFHKYHVFNGMSFVIPQRRLIHKSAPIRESKSKEPFVSQASISEADMKVLELMEDTFSKATDMLQENQGSKAVVYLKEGYNDCIDFLTAANQSTGKEEELLVTELFKQKALQIRNNSGGKLMMSAAFFSIASTFSWISLVNYQHFFDQLPWALREATSFACFILMAYFAVRTQRTFRVFRYFRILSSAKKQWIAKKFMFYSVYSL